MASVINPESKSLSLNYATALGSLAFAGILGPASDYLVNQITPGTQTLMPALVAASIGCYVGFQKDKKIYSISQKENPAQSRWQSWALHPLKQHVFGAVPSFVLNAVLAATSQKAPRLQTALCGTSILPAITRLAVVTKKSFRELKKCYQSEAPLSEKIKAGSIYTFNTVCALGDAAIAVSAAYFANKMITA